MTEDLHRSTQDLITKIERKDRKFRLMQSVSLAVIGIGVIILLVLNYNAQTQTKTVLLKQNQLITEIKNVEEQNNKLSMQNKDGIDSIHQQINCVLEFFAQTPVQRTNSYINTNQPACIVGSSSGGATGGTKSTVNSNATPQPQAPKANNNSGSSSGTPSNPKPTPQPNPQPQGFLQRNVVKPIMNVINGAKGLL